MASSEFETLEKVLEHFKILRAQYCIQLRNLQEAGLSDSILTNLRENITELGKLLENNGVDIQALNQEVENANKKRR